MNNKKYLLSALFSLMLFWATAQVRFSANPVAISRNADALLSAVATSSYRTVVNGEISIRVTEEGKTLPVMTVYLLKVSILPGSNNLSQFRDRANRIFYDNELSNIIRNTGAFAPANYSICFEFIPDDKLLPVIETEQCFFAVISPRMPLTLIQPIDTICERRPVFIWLGRKAVSQTVAFKVICVQVGKDQSAEESLQNNAPVFNELLYRQVNQMNYPPGSPALKEGIKYAWQVFEVAGNNILNSSEIFSFTVACKADAQKTVVSFAEIKTFYTGKKYYFTSSINFSFNNPYAEKKLHYAITHIATQKKLTNLPEIKMSKGLNMIQLNTEDIKGLQKNEQYKVEVYNLATTTHYINFIIKE